MLDPLNDSIVNVLNRPTTPKDGFSFDPNTFLDAADLELAVALCDALFEKATGLSPMERRTCAYYSIATHYQEQFDNFPLLVAYGKGGTGKSSTLEAANAVCKHPNLFSAKGMTPPAFREELVKASPGTAIVDEVDGFADIRMLETWLYNRFSKSIAKARKMVPEGERAWLPEVRNIFGATILAKREPFSDPALRSRSIWVPTPYNSERDPQSYSVVNIDDPLAIKIRETIKDRQIPQRVYIPQNYSIAARILDAYEPIICLAQMVDDEEFLNHAFKRMQLESDTLKDGQTYELSPLILQRLISAMTKNLSNGGLQLKLRPVKIDDEITQPIRKQYGQQATPWQVAEILRSFGFLVKRSGGVNRVYPDIATLRKACQESGIDDEVL